MRLFEDTRTAEEPTIAPGGASSPRPPGGDQADRASTPLHIELVTGVVMMLLLVFIWGTSEYQNAGGWPTSGFSQRLQHPQRVEHVDRLPAHWDRTGPRRGPGSCTGESRSPNTKSAKKSNASTACTDNRQRVATAGRVLRWHVCALFRSRQLGVDRAEAASVRVHVGRCRGSPRQCRPRTPVDAVWLTATDGGSTPMTQLPSSTNATSWIAPNELTSPVTTNDSRRFAGWSTRPCTGSMTCGSPALTCGTAHAVWVRSKRDSFCIERSPPSTAGAVMIDDRPAVDEPFRCSSKGWTSMRSSCSTRRVRC